ncbi:MAG: Gfo/Idh/MocA family oxidoreductase, partial [Deinococcus-Thermus bacterium]|nr:Gfo/Idh/MocA family oxidoreductase [Deinococcota bacterium]
MLIGAGRFGRNHLDEIRRLEADGSARLAGIVVNSETSAARLQGESVAPVHRGLSADLLEGVDAAVVATPTATHEEIAATCLEHCDVLVEKPIATSAAGADRLATLAERHGRVLMPGHVFRFHPVVRRLAEIAEARAEPPVRVDVTFVNAPVPWSAGLDPRLEFIHCFDIADLILGEEPEIVLPGRRDGLAEASLAYPSGARCHMRMGWSPSGPTRRVVLRYDDLTVEADLVNGVIVSRSASHAVEKEFFPGPPVALRAQLSAFLDRIARRGTQPGRDAELGATPRIGVRAVAQAERARPRKAAERPRVAVVGAGVFGATIADELGAFADVDLFERRQLLVLRRSARRPVERVPVPIQHLLPVLGAAGAI